jgi:hypothetical protein
VKALQHVSPAPLFFGSPAFNEQAGGRRVAFEDVDVSIHHKDRQRHDIKQSAVQPLIQKLNIKPAH